MILDAVVRKQVPCESAMTKGTAGHVAEYDERLARTGVLVASASLFSWRRASRRRLFADGGRFPTPPSHAWHSIYLSSVET